MFRKPLSKTIAANLYAILLTEARFVSNENEHQSFNFDHIRTDTHRTITIIFAPQLNRKVCENLAAVVRHYIRFTARKSDLKPKYQNFMPKYPFSPVILV